MKLPHLDQLVPLERGEAGVLAEALAVLVRDVTQTAKPVNAMEAITLPAVAALATKLARLHQRELNAPVRPGRRPRPRHFRVSYDQLAVLLHYRGVLHYCGLGEVELLQLQAALGRFQQQSLNLEHLIRFSGGTAGVMG